MILFFSKDFLIMRANILIILADNIRSTFLRQFCRIRTGSFYSQIRSICVCRFFTFNLTLGEIAIVQHSKPLLRNLSEQKTAFSSCSQTLLSYLALRIFLFWFIFSTALFYKNFLSSYHDTITLIKNTLKQIFLKNRLINNQRDKASSSLFFHQFFLCVPVCVAII